MQTSNQITINADPMTVFELAAAVEHWPEILPHYRWVHILHDDGAERLVEMAARRDLIPVRWQATQIRDPITPRITFQHVRGVTTGMEVAWIFEPIDSGVRVTIDHQFEPSWPLVGNLVADRIIGPLFIENIAGKTLRRIKALAEAQAGVPR